MNLLELKNKSVAELIKIAQELEIENMARTADKGEMIFEILKHKAIRLGEDIFGGGVL